MEPKDVGNRSRSTSCLVKSKRKNSNLNSNTHAATRFQSTKTRNPFKMVNQRCKHDLCKEIVWLNSDLSTSLILPSHTTMPALCFVYMNATQLENELQKQCPFCKNLSLTSLNAMPDPHLPTRNIHHGYSYELQLDTRIRVSGTTCLYMMSLSFRSITPLFHNVFLMATLTSKCKLELWIMTEEGTKPSAFELMYEEYCIVCQALTIGEVRAGKRNKRHCLVVEGEDNVNNFIYTNSQTITLTVL